MSDQDKGRKERRRKRAARHAEVERTPAARPPVVDHPDVAPGDPDYVDTAAGLAALCEALAAEGSFAYDTEFIGEESFFPRICVIQVATRAGVTLVDPFAIHDLGPLHELIATREVTTLVHDGGQDLEPVRRALRRTPEGIIDTQVCAAFADMPWPTSLAKTVERFTGHALAKGHTLTDWDRRPLTEMQRWYAADDVRYLPLVWSRLRAELERRGTLAWALAECEATPRAVPGFDVERQVRKVLRSAQLGARAVTVLRRLIELRYELAAELDVPLRDVVGDDALVELAKRQPRDTDELVACRQLSRRGANAHGERLLAAIARGLEDAPEPLPLQRSLPESADDRQRIDALWSALSLHCLAQGIAPGLVTTRTELARWYLLRDRGSPEALFAPGSWREAAAGAWLGDFLAGRRPLAVGWQAGALTRA
jgi:ribonuclease D